MRSAVVAFAAALLAASAAEAASPVGLWSTPERGGKVQVSTCGDGICGRVADGADIRANPDVRDIKNSDPALRTRRIKGMAIFEDMTGGPTEWKGKVYDPTRGQTFSGSVTMVDANTLKLKGCALAILCQTQVWHRIG